MDNWEFVKRGNRERSGFLWGMEKKPTSKNFQGVLERSYHPLNSPANNQNGKTI